MNNEERSDEPDPDEDGPSFEDLYRNQFFASVHAQPDPLLQALAHIADAELASLGVTLVLDGQVVSGTLVGEAEWLNEVASELAAAGPGGEGFATAFREAAAGARLSKIHDSHLMESGVRSPVPTPVHLHLLRATVQNGTGATGPAVPLRIRLSKVSGWHVGEWALA